MTLTDGFKILKDRLVIGYRAAPEGLEDQTIATRRSRLRHHRCCRPQAVD